jgi:hypothetical protein
MVGNYTGRLKTGVFRNPVFLVCLFIFGVHYGLVRLGFSVPVLQHYLNDLLCLPLALSVTLFLQRSFFYRHSAYVLTAYQVGLAAAYFSLAFEVIFPLFMKRYTADILDVVAYSVGGFIFYKFINHPEKA